MDKKTKKCKYCWKDFEPFDEKRSEICEWEECRRLQRKSSLRWMDRAMKHLNNK